MAFDILPTELSVEIIRNLEGTSDLHNVSLCSRLLYELAQPLLYSTIAQTTSNIPSLIRTFLAKPSLAQYVKHFIGTSFDTYSPALRDLTEDQRDQICDEWVSQRGSGIQFSDKLFDQSFSSNWDNIVAIFLLLFSQNLESITLTYHKERLVVDFGSRHPYIEEVMAKMADLQRHGVLLNSMSNLREISIANESVTVPCYAVLPYLAIPSVSSWKGGLTSEYGEGELYTMFRGKISMEDLSIRGEWVADPELDQLMLCFTSLKRFKYEHDDEETPPSFDGVLSHLAHCLEELSINCLNDTWEIYRDENIYVGIGSLSKFESLWRIEMSAGILIGMELFLSEDSEGGEDEDGEEYPHYHPEQVTPGELNRSYSGLVHEQKYWYPKH